MKIHSAFKWYWPLDLMIWGFIAFSIDTFIQLLCIVWFECIFDAFIMRWNFRRDWLIDWTARTIALSSTHSIILFEFVKRILQFFINWHFLRYFIHNFIWSETIILLECFWIHSFMDNGDCTNKRLTVLRQS